MTRPFAGCKSLKYFTVPNGNVELGENIFGDKTELKVMIFNGLPKNISKAFPKMKDSYTTIVLRYSMVSSFMSEYDYFALLPIRIDVETNGKSDLILVSTATDEDNEIFNYVWIETGDEALATQFSILSLYEENFRIGLNTAGASEDDIVVRLNSVLLPDNKVNKLEFPAFDFTGYCFDTYFKLGNYVIAVYDRTTGVDKIEPNLFEEKFDIYTVSGMCISRNFTIAKLNMMPKGIYILKSETHTMKYAR